MGDIEDDWVLDTFGVDPRSYPPFVKPVPVGGIRNPDGAPVPLPHGTRVPTPAVAQPAPPAPPPLTPAQWLVQNKPAMDSLNDADGRVVMPGPGQVAQVKVHTTLAAINTALQTNNVQMAAKLLATVQSSVTIVRSQPDAVTAPITPGKHPDQILFGKETPALNVPGITDPQDIMQSDVNQNAIGDCYLISVIGEIAKLKPEVIRKMIKNNGDGTYTVTFYQHKTGISGFFASLFGGTDFEPITETVDSNFGSNVVNSQPGQAEVGNQHEIWVAVVEKAFAKLHGGYDKITHGGYPADAMETLTGKKANTTPAANVTVADLQADLKSGKPVVLDTLPQITSATSGLFPSHAYMLDSIEQTAQGPLIHLKNPWGNANPPPVPFNQLCQSIGWIDTGGAL